jgi:drug/metabolite transporter (DMT)-like permease
MVKALISEQAWYWQVLFAGPLGPSCKGVWLMAEVLTGKQVGRNSVGAFFYLLIVGSLIGFVAYVWLLRHVGTLIAGTYAYVNPVLAVVLGVFWDNEPVGILMVIGLGIILAGVSLVRMGRVVARLETTA